MSKACKTCKGRGRWQENWGVGDNVELVWHYCEKCHGTGRSDDVEDDEDFDFGRDSDANIE